MSIVILCVIILCYILIATERLTNINKAAIAIFAGTLSWVLYISYGTDFLMDLHKIDYMDSLKGAIPTSDAAKSFIWKTIFLPNVGLCAEVVLFLLATMTIVEILHNNGCFDFVTVWLRTKNSRLLMWKLAFFTFILSANLDNITTTVMMLTIMNSILPRSKDRIVYGAVVVLAANFGGACTVIGEPTTLVLWNKGAITATDYTLSMILPCLIGLAIPTFFISRNLSETVQLDQPMLPYRGDDTNLTVWQRLILLIVGIGGLWFIPTFHNITKLSPFLGAFCVLSILWIINEIINRNLMGSDRRLTRSIPQQLQYSIIQLMLYVMGIMLAVEVAHEAGIFRFITQNINFNSDNVWILGIISGVVSLFLDSFTTSMTMVTLFDVAPADCSSALETFTQNGSYWKMISYAATVGSSIFGIASVAGIVYLQSQRVGMMWYHKTVGIKVLISGLIGLAVLWFTA